jgi:putative copper resistance protein D
MLLAAAALFWWPIVAADPTPHRLRHGGRLVSLLAMMPVMSAIGLAIYFAHDLLYEHYALLDRAWGPSPLIDQQVGGLLMWAASDLVMLLAIAFVVADWMRTDERRQRVLDAQRAHTAGLC